MVNREALAARFNGYCPWCGTPMTATFAIHHRRLRKQGGTDDPVNLVALHHRCHNGTHRSVHLAPKEAHRRGFIVRSWQDPADVPLLYHGDIEVTLDNTIRQITIGGTHGW